MSRSAQFLRYMMASMEQLRMIKVGQGAKKPLYGGDGGSHTGRRPCWHFKEHPQCKAHVHCGLCPQSHKGTRGLGPSLSFNSSRR